MSTKPGKPTSWRPSVEAKRLLRKVAEAFGITQTAVIELAIRDMAKRHKIN